MTSEGNDTTCVAVTAENARVQDGCILGLAYQEVCGPVILGPGAIIRSGTTIYADVRAGSDLQTGHNVLIREHTSIGDHVLVGTNTVIEGQVEIGSFVKLESNCFIPTHVVIGSFVFFGPGVVLTNDRYPLRRVGEYVPEGPTIEDGVTLGGGAVLCPGVRVRANSFIAAGAVVTRDVPTNSLAVGAPAEIRPLPDKLRRRNMARSWERLLGKTDEGLDG